MKTVILKPAGRSRRGSFSSFCFSIVFACLLSALAFSFVVRAGEARTFTITYNANGGTDAPAAQTKTEDVALSLQKDIPQREGHSFLGWGLSKDSKEPDYRPGDSYSKNADLTLYALWARRSYPVHYDAAGGSFEKPDQEKFWDIPLTLYPDIPQRKGYTFTGWAERADAAAVSYAPGASYEKNAPLTLYALWQKNKTVAVRYNANGGKNTPKEQKASAGERILLSKSAPSKEDCYFLGWTAAKTADLSADAPDPDFTGTDCVSLITNAASGQKNDTVLYAPGAAFSSDTDRTLYACWHKNRPRTITGKDSYTKSLGSGRFPLDAVLSPAAGNPLTYASSDKSVVKVSSSGTVTVTGCGKCVITIRAAAGKHYAAAKKKVTVRVRPGTVKLTSLTSPEKGKLNVRWKKTSGITSYECKIASPGKTSKVFAVPGDKNYNMTLNGLESGRTYTIRLRALKTVSSKTHRGAWSAAKNICVK